MICSNPKLPVLKRLKSIYANYHCGWLSESLVDFYITQLCEIFNEEVQTRTFGAMQCNDTIKILNGQQTFKSMSKT